MLKSTTIRHTLQVALASIFMLVFLYAQVGSQLHVVSHSPVEERVCEDPENACHLRIVHSDFENGCDHEAHLIEDNNLHCSLCAILSSEKPFLTTSSVAISKTPNTKSENSKYAQYLFIENYPTTDNRGPPFYS